MSLGARLALVFLAALIGLSFAGCVPLQSLTDHGWDGAQSIRRGKLKAEAQCGSCHDAGPGPTFATMANDYYGDMLLRQFQVIGEVGHYGMAPRLIPVQDRADMAAYIQQLGGP